MRKIFHPTTKRLINQPYEIISSVLALFNYEHWKRLTVKDQDPTFVGDVLGISMDILSRSWQNQADSEKAHFSIIPKKIKVVSESISCIQRIP
jgi:hypothetical protein